MAERRMFAKTIIDSDAFLELPLSAQALYFHLSMRADDEGFVNNPRKIQRIVGVTDNDMKTLIEQNFVIPFESGIVVITHWKIHNYIQSDRRKPTINTQEKAQLSLDGNKMYTRCIQSVIDNADNEGCNETLMKPAFEPVDTSCIHSVSTMDTQVRLGKVSLGKDSLGEVSSESVHSDTVIHTITTNSYGQHNNVNLTTEQYDSLISDYGQAVIDDYIERISRYIKDNGKKPYDNHYQTICDWLNKDGVKKKTEHSYNLDLILQHSLNTNIHSTQGR